MFCTACGISNRDNADFCTNCGKPLKETVSAPPGSSPPRYAFASDAATPDGVNFAAIAATGVAKTSPMGNVRVNKKFVRSATDEQLAGVMVAFVVQGVKRDRVVKTMVKQGVPQAKAADLEGKVRLAVDAYQRTPEGRQVLRKKYRRQMFGGLAWLAGGVVVTLVTYSLASPGGTYLLAYGPVIWGLAAFIQGFARWRKFQ